MAALDEGFGLETVSSLVKRYDAVAGINGGFFKEDGRPAGVLRINGEWYGFPLKDRAALLWGDHQVEIKRLAAQPRLRIHRTARSIDGDLYLPTFHRTTLTDQERFETVVKNDRVIEVRHGGSSTIPQNGFVISSPTHYWTQGTRMELVIPLPHAKHIVGGVPILIQNGEILDPHLEPAINSFFEPHRRTAVGIRGDGTWLLVVTEQKITLEELALAMQNLGAIDAINLDGGGSSTMIWAGKCVTTEERPVGDAILVKKRPMR